MKVAFNRDSEREIEKATIFYARQSPGLDEKFLHDLTSAIAHIEAFPRMAKADSRGVRRVTLSRFPYVVFYRVIKELAKVYAVAHQRRKPGYWRRRVPR